MAVWMVRAGKHGERESFALEKNVAVIGWREMPDLSRFNSREEIENFYPKIYPEAMPKSIKTWAAQLWAFRGRIQKGDLVVLPLKTRSAIAIGEVTGPYQYRADFPEDARHARPVKWLIKDKPRSAFDQDILYSLGAYLTVCQITKNKAEERIRALLRGVDIKISTDMDTEDIAVITDLDQYAKDQIRAFINRKYKGHELARLIMEILVARGYYAILSPPGADGGVDIVAGRGPMGFEGPKLCVQVKSGDSPIDVKVLYELQGTMKNFGAEQGLLVSWGGFKSSVLKEARKLFFEIRLWDADDVVRALMEIYEQLSEDIQAEIPLKKTWVLVLEE